MKEAYRQQKSNAKTRGIAFNFTYDDWCLWWKEQLGPDWPKKRGCRRGQYVMARKRDEGAYERGNVKAVLSQTNVRGYNQRRGTVSTSGTKHLSHDTVRAIYLDADKYSVIAERYNVTKHRIQCIKQKHYYCKITDELD